MFRLLLPCVRESALSVLTYPSLYGCAFVGAPVCDWCDYDTAYTERVLGLPLEKMADYERSSLLTYARDLLRPLLLVHGAADDNVYFMHAIKLSSALFAAGRPHAFLPLAGTHMLADPMGHLHMTIQASTAKQGEEKESTVKRNITTTVPLAETVKTFRAVPECHRLEWNGTLWNDKITSTADASFHFLLLLPFPSPT